ncbi:pre-rRNA-processing protein TSR2 homolog [Anguilla rostrata]|uniref:pre-rRNA-processing protein TSR2 homolog n=1 Tax=Anguilla rostrata TaxID=7938 RepID=UPI0030D34DB4
MDAPLTARELFTEAVRAVLETWPVLQIAVDNGFGGVHSQQKANWMVDAVQQYFRENNNLEQYEVEDFLADLMNNEFDTVVDDGSLPQVALQVSQFFKQCEQGNWSEVEGQIAKLSQKKATGRAKATSVQTPANEEEEEESEEEEEGAEAMDCGEATETKSSAKLPNEQDPPSPPSAGPDEDGWTVVRRKK